MKFRPLYIYIGLAAAFLIVIIIFSGNQSKVPETTGEVTTENMPEDDIHQPFKDNPTGNNVSEEVKHKLEVMKKEVEANPEDTAKVREYADFLSAAHKPQEAIKYYNQILEKDPKRTDVLFSLTFIYYNSGDINRAEELTQRVLSYDPDNVMARYNLGAVYATRGEFNKAREIWQNIVEEYPNNETTELAKNSLKQIESQ